MATDLPENLFNHTNYRCCHICGCEETYYYLCGTDRDCFGQVGRDHCIKGHTRTVEEYETLSSWDCMCKLPITIFCCFLLFFTSLKKVLVLDSSVWAKYPHAHEIKAPVFDLTLSLVYCWTCFDCCQCIERNIMVIYFVRLIISFLMNIAVFILINIAGSGYPLWTYIVYGIFTFYFLLLWLIPGFIDFCCCKRYSDCTSSCRYKTVQTFERHFTIYKWISLVLSVCLFVQAYIVFGEEGSSNIMVLVLFLLTIWDIAVVVTTMFALLEKVEIRRRRKIEPLLRRIHPQLPDVMDI